MNNERAELIEKPTLEVAAKKALTALEDLLEHGSSAPWKSWEKALNATVPLRQAILAADAQGGEPVARVEVMNTGGNAGLATRIVEIYNPHRDALRPGALLYTHHQPQAVAQGCAGCGKTSTSDSMWALYCLDCTQKHGIGAMPWIELVHELCPEGIEDLCDECGGEDSKCHAGCTYRKARAMLSASPASPAAAQVAQPLTDGDLVEHLAATGNLPGADYGSFRMGYCFALEYHGIGKDRA